MDSGGYCNGPAADWARRNIKTPVEIRTRFSSTAGKVFTYSLQFCVPAAEEAGDLRLVVALPSQRGEHLPLLAGEPVVRHDGRPLRGG
jgi:hypothetical protein